MSAYFADTSALAKRYIPEIGSRWTLSWILPEQANIIVISDITLVEMFSLLSRRQREGTLKPADTFTLQQQILLHMHRDYLRVQIHDSVLTNARELVSLYPLRALDAIQLACANYWRDSVQLPFTFVSADVRLLAAAHGEGFLTENPADHPN